LATSALSSSLSSGGRGSDARADGSAPSRQNPSRLSHSRAIFCRRDRWDRSLPRVERPSKYTLTWSPHRRHPRNVASADARNTA